VTHRLDLSDADLQILNDALVQMPYFRVALLVNKINRQLEAQLAPADPPEPEPEEQA
jgi:hypothetical protein